MRTRTGSRVRGPGPGGRGPIRNPKSGIPNARVAAPFLGVLAFLVSAQLVAMMGAEAAAGGPEARPTRPAPRQQTPPEPPEQPPHEGDEGQKVVVRGEQQEFEAWCLPLNYRNADGSFNQDAIVAQQKKRLETLNQKLPAKFRLAETRHYLVLSDADSKMTGQFVRWSEALYENLRRQFDIGPRDRVWDGKCILLVFNSRATFAAHSRTFDGFDGSRAGAYFAVEARAEDEPQLVHMCLPLDSRDPRRLQELFAHEGTHAFFQLYRKSVDLPLWLHEGLAEFMTVVNDPQLKARKVHYAVLAARQGTPIAGLLQRKPYTGLSYPEYNISYTLVDFLVTGGKARFKKFVDGLKDGKDQETALKEAYGWGLGELERRWRLYAAKYLAAGR